MSTRVGMAAICVVAVLSAACRYDRDRIPTIDAALSDAAPGKIDGAGRDAEHDAGRDAADLDDASETDASGDEAEEACEAGFELVAGHCADVDECADPKTCVAPLHCRNTRASFVCECPSGYLRGALGQCTDIDECTLSPKVCDERAFCTNSGGTYACACPAYFTDSQQGRLCEDQRYQWDVILPLRGAQAMPFGDELMLAGTFDGPLTVAGTQIASAGLKDVFVARLDAERDLVWMRRFGGVNEDEVYWANLDSQGNVILTGYTDGGLDLGDGPIVTLGRRARFVVKLDAANGTPQWSKVLYNIDEKTSAWEGFVSVDPSDNVLLTGRFHDTLTIGSTQLAASGLWDAFAAKLSPTGVPLWAKRWGGPGNDNGRAIAANSSGELLLFGQFEQSLVSGADTLVSAGLADVFVLKLDAEGEPIWSKRFGGAGWEECGRMAVAPNGDVIVAGSFQGAAAFGTSETFVAQGDVDGYLSVLRTDGSARFARRIGGNANEAIWGVAAGPNNEAIVAGLFEETVDFGEGPRTSRGGGDAFVAKYDNAGALVWSLDFGSSESDSAGNVRADPQGRIYVSGWFDGSPVDLAGRTIYTNGLYVLQLAP